MIFMTECDSRRLTEAILALVHELRASRKDGQIRDELKKGLLALEHKLSLMEKHIMSAISVHAEKQNAFNARQGAAIDSVVASQAGIVEDIQALNDKITELQNSPGQVTPEDQALLDQLETQGSDLTAKVEAVAEALKVLDAQIPPKLPVG